MRSRMLLLVLIPACTTESWYELTAETKPIAVGATTLVAVVSGRCTAADSADHCTYDGVTIKSATFDTPGFFEHLATTQGRMDYLAVAEGASTLTVVADNGDNKTFTHRMVALPANQATVTATLRDEPCSAPAQFAIGMRATLASELRHDDIVLGGTGYHPFELTGDVTLDPDRSTAGALVLQVGNTPGASTVTSPVDSSLAFPLTAFAPASVEQVVIGDFDTSHWIPLSSIRPAVDLIVGGRPVCGDTLARTANVETPTICQIYEEDGDGASTTKTVAGMSALLLRAYQIGDCRVTVTLDGTSITATKTFTVTM